jgi:hypothetical protein
VQTDAMRAVASAGSSLADADRVADEATGGTVQPLFQTLLNFIPIDAPFVLVDLYINPVILPCVGSWLDLEFRIYAWQDGNNQGYLRCPSEVFNRHMAECLADEYLAVLRRAAHTVPGAGRMVG